MERRSLTTREIAKFCSVSQRTVVKWISEGKINVYRTPGKHSRVKREDFIGFLNKYNIPIPEELDAGECKKKILIVDDDKAIVSTLKRILLVNKKYLVDVAYDGFSAGQKFNAFKPDLVLLDIKMPKLDGFEVCSLIRADPKNKDIKIIIISGYVNEQDAKRLIKLGSNAYFTKPFNNKDLIEKIENLLEENKKFSKEKMNG